MDYSTLTALHLDALKEVFNIGAGHGAKALSNFLNKAVDINVPDLEIIDIEDIYNKFALEEVVVGVLIKILGDAPGNILFTFKDEAAVDIIKDLTGMEVNSIEESEIGQSALCEIGNIIGASYINAISDFTGLRMIVSVPALAHDMIGAIITTIFVEALQYTDKILEINTDLKVVNNKINACLYYLPKEDSLDKILNSIGL